MIIIDEHANEALVQTLRTLSSAYGQYAIRFHAIPVDAALHNQLLMLLEQRFPESQLYAEDSDAVLLVRDTSLKECKRALFAAAVMCGVEPAEAMGEIYDLSLQSGNLASSIEKNIEQRLQAQQQDAARQAQQKAAAQSARRRHDILELPGNIRDLNTRRKGRDSLELMMIEDDVFSSRLVENVLGKQYSMTTLASAELALATYAHLAPDLLFLDINLPDVTGHELLEKIITIDPHAYVVMLSGNADRDNIMQAMKRGAKGFIAKPFTREKLFQYIELCSAHKKESA